MRYDYHPIKAEKPQKIEFVMDGYKYTLGVKKVLSINVGRGFDSERVSVDMICSAIDSKPCNSDFMEDVTALAKQYGLQIINLEVK